MDSIEERILSSFINFDITLFNCDLDFVNFINNSLNLLTENFENLLSHKYEFNDNIINKLFPVCISSLQTFILINWIYDQNLDLENNLKFFLNSIEFDLLKNELILDNNNFQPKINYPQLLLISKKILEHCSNDKIHFLIWKLRFLIIYHSISNNIEYRINIGITYEDLINKLNEKLNNNNDSNLRLRINLEICQFYLLQNDVQHIQKILSDCNEITSLEIKTIGVLGKKTKFQKDPKSILFLNLLRLSDKQNLIKMKEEQTDLPKNLILNDDTLLPEPVFLDNIQENKIKLYDDEEALILTIIKYSAKCGINQDEILKEEILIYLNYLLCNAKVWSVVFESMYQRSIYESTNTRKIERSMLQLNELLNNIKKNNIKSQNSNKLHLFYSSIITPIWKIKKNYGEILISLGCIKDALQIYEELDFWEDIVYCYKQLGRKKKAIEIINQQIKLKKTPYLLCLLGDLTDDISCYEKAWSLSNEKSYLAQKCLGYHYFNIKDYQKALICLKKSIDLNKNQNDTLQKLAFAALEQNNYVLAAESYRKVVQYDIDNFQAWNNLAKAYIKLNEKFRAFKILQECLKHNYENWKVWENYIAVSTDVGYFSEVIYAWHRLIDLKSKYNDDQIMNILINYLCNDNNINNQEIKYLNKRTLELLGRMTANFECSSDLWLLYSKFLLHLNDQDVDKIFNCLNKSLKALFIKFDDWIKESNKIIKNLSILNSLFNYFEKCLLLCSDNENRKRHLASFRLNSKCMISSIKKKEEYWINNEIYNDSINKNINELSVKLSNFH